MSPADSGGQAVGIQGNYFFKTRPARQTTNGAFRGSSAPVSWSF
jgi:hypothetical protein